MTTSEDYASQYADLLKQLTEGVTAQQTAYTDELKKQEDIDIGNLRGMYEQSGLANAGQMFKTIGTEIQPEYAGKAAAHYADLTQQALQTQLQGTGNLVNMQQQQEQIDFNKRTRVAELTQDLMNEQGFSYAEAFSAAKNTLGYAGEDIPNPNPTTGTESSGPNIASQTGQTLLSLINSAPGTDTLKALENNPMYSRFMGLDVVKEALKTAKQGFVAKTAEHTYNTAKLKYSNFDIMTDSQQLSGYNALTTQEKLKYKGYRNPYKAWYLEQFQASYDAMIAAGDAWMEAQK